MGRTRKDSRNAGTVIEVVRRADGSFDIFRNREIHREAVHPDGLNAELCGRFGYCQEEYEAILRELNETGTATVRF
jgi:hypothetical protein